VLNSLGQPVAYKLMPGQNVMLFVPPQASVTKRATFMTKHLWGTPYHPVERYAAGAYPNQHPGGRRWHSAQRRRTHLPGPIVAVMDKRESHAFTAGRSGRCHRPQDLPARVPAGTTALAGPSYRA
jgi:hypothetical protein